MLLTKSCNGQSLFGIVLGAGVAQWQFSDDAEQELWDVLGSNPALHP